MKYDFEFEGVIPPTLSIFFPQEITCGAPDGYPLLVLQEVHCSYGRGVRAVDVLCDM